MRTAVRFPDDDATAFACKLETAPLAERIAAAKELLYHLDAASDVSATGIYENGRLTVTVKLGGTDEWVVDYHLVWPEPQLNNQHLSVLKLISWSAAAPPRSAPDPGSATSARKKADKRLRKLIETLTGPDGPLEDRVTLLTDTA